MQFSQSRLFSRSPLFNDVIKKYFTSAQMYFCVFNASVLFHIFAKSHGCTISLPWSWMRVGNLFIRSRKNDVQKYSQMETHITVISVTAFWPVWACRLIMTRSCFWRLLYFQRPWKVDWKNFHDRIFNFHRYF